ncbi:MAG: hypothetical protein JW990_05100 [Thermoleophilia bacterium]|nr:hypothetical protein [Thermoleophilia bacterium]
MSEIRRDQERRSFLRRPVGRRVAVAFGVAVLALAVLSVVDVFGAGGPSIVERATAALDPGENAIVHVKIRGTETGPDGYQASWTEESWTRTESPYTRRDIMAFAGAPVMETVWDTEGFWASYDAETDTIHMPPVEDTTETVEPEADVYRELILRLLTSGDAVSEGADSVDGREVIRIASTGDYGSAADGTRYGVSYYVDPDTKNPVKWRTTGEGGRVVEIHFDAYEYLAADETNLKLLDLRVQYPQAAIDTDRPSYQYGGGWPSPELGGEPPDEK